VEWLVGFVVGLLLLSATVGFLWSMGLYRVARGGDASALWLGLVVYGPHALFEEILLRALLFKISEESLGTRAALAFEAAIFGALHLGNPGASLVGAIAIALEAGVLL